MNDLLKKLNCSGRDPVIVLNAPAGFNPTLQAFPVAATVHNVTGKLKASRFAVFFATARRVVDAMIKELAPELEGVAALWIGYPKGSSKRYTCDPNRGTGWTEVGKAGFEPVRQVAIDENWSALRFRRVGFIKKMTRSFAMTEEGKANAKKGR